MTVLAPGRLGAGGPTISSVGVGTWAMGGPWRMGWGMSDDEASVATLVAAFDAGVNWVDTAPVYGDGRAEHIVGRATQGRADVLVLTKCGLTDGGADGSAEAVRTSCLRSLEGLQRDRVDVLQLHWPDPSVPVETTWQAMAELQAAGLVDRLGISNHSLDLVVRAHAVAPVEVVQLRFSLLDQRAGQDLLPWCAKTGVGALAYSVLGSGLLAGEVDRAALPSDDWRRTDQRFAEEAEAAAPLLSRLRALGDEPASVAIAWVLAQHGVSGAIVGLRDRAEVEGLVSAAGRGLSRAESERLAEAVGAQSLAARPGLR